MLSGSVLRGDLRARAALCSLACLALTACAGSQTPRPAPTVTVTATATRGASTPAMSPSSAGELQPESCVHVATGADGNITPVTCPDGHPNAYAMPALQGAAPRMMGLGQSATPAVVQSAACADLANSSTNPIEESAYKLAKALNGWSFGVDPADGGLFSFCS